MSRTATAHTRKLEPSKSKPSRSLAEAWPVVAACWHPTRNGDLTPYDVTPYSATKVWWICAAGHVWQSAVASVVRSREKRGLTGCKTCGYASRGLKQHARAIENPLSSTHSELAAQWHPKLNGDVTPHDVSRASKSLVYWRCLLDKSHVWKASPDRRVYGQTGCPYCLKQKINRSNSLATLAPKVAKLWHPRKNGKLKPDHVAPKSGRMVWWQCPKDTLHVWQNTVKNVTNAQPKGCPFCAGKKTCKTNSLAVMCPQIAAEWHDRKNGHLTPADVTPGSHRRVWWRCSINPKHQWQTTVVNRTTRQSGCPYDSRLSEHYPALAAQWHARKNGALKPSDVGWGSEKKVWWQCKRGHAWQASVRNRTQLGRGCPHCKSLAVRYPIVAKQWHPTLNRGLTPFDVTVGKRGRVWWRCQAGHVWMARISGVVYCRQTYNSNGCPKCFNDWRRNSATTARGQMLARRRNAARDYEREYEDERAVRRDQR